MKFSVQYLLPVARYTKSLNLAYDARVVSSPLLRDASYDDYSCKDAYLLLCVYNFMH